MSSSFTPRRPWQRPTSREAWLTEIRSLSRHTSVYQPNAGTRHALWIVVLSCLWSYLLVPRIHGAHRAWVPPTVVLVLALGRLAWRGVMAFRYQTQSDRIRLTQLQPAELEQQDKRALSRKPELGVYVHHLRPLDVPLLYGDLLTLRRFSPPGKDPIEDLMFTPIVSYIVVPFVVFMCLMLVLGGAGMLR